VATCIYTIIGYVGYLMFGRDVNDEVNIDRFANLAPH
jgi:amino acid permease